MDEENMSELNKRAPKNKSAKILLLGTFDPEGDTIIRDPYYVRYFFIFSNNCILLKISYFYSATYRIVGWKDLKSVTSNVFGLVEHFYCLSINANIKVKNEKLIKFNLISLLILENIFSCI